MNAQISPEALLEALQWRYATKKYDPAKKLSDGTWRAIEQAVTLAPSSYGLQPWKMLVISDPAVRAQLRPAAWGQSQVTDASHFVLFAARTDLNAEYVHKFIRRVAEVRGVPVDALAGYRDMMLGSISSRSAEHLVGWAQRQAYIGLGVLLETAALLGVDATPMEGFEPAKFDEILGLKGQHLTATVMCAIGFRAADDAYAQYKKVRWAKEELIVNV